MSFDESLTDGKAQASAFGSSGNNATEELLEHPRSRVGRKARTMVAHLERDVAAVVTRRDLDDRARRREFDRIAHQIGERALQQEGFTVDDQIVPVESRHLGGPWDRALPRPLLEQGRYQFPNAPHLDSGTAALAAGEELGPDLLANPPSRRGQCLGRVLPQRHDHDAFACDLGDLGRDL